ncbi:MAG: hypothetical protein EBR82_62700, partial [Caulobacteraceae bacterium]|nr:hypothetical protein [Caulobacteraceae bacterium]
RRMKAFFDRHEVDKKGATWDEQGKGWQAWNGWGGDAGYAWAKKVVRQMESRDKELSTNQKDIIEFLRGRDCGQDEGGTFGPGNDCATGYGRPKQEGGYTPMRPGGKWPPGYKVGEGRTEEQKKPSEKATKKEDKKVEPKKPQEAPVPKYKWDGKGKRPSRGVKIFNGQNDELDWNKFRQKQIDEDKNAIWKAGDVGIKGKNLDFDNWVEQVRNDKTSWQITDDFRGRYYNSINEKPDSDVAKKLVDVMNRQKSFQQKGTMYRGMGFGSNDEAEKFVNAFKNGGKLNRTLTSFTTDESVADSFSGGSPAQVRVNLLKSKNLKRFSGLDRGSMGEKEYVLTYGARLRTIKSRVEKKKTLGGREFNEYILDVEEY